MRKLFICLILIAIFLPALACYNEKHVDKNGKTTTRSEPMEAFFNEPDKKRAREYVSNFDLNKITQYSADDQSDIAVNLAYLGEYEKALFILRRLQRSNPTDYNIAANLGTTYELVGKNDSALIFIRKGIQLNEDSHEGSEWVHVKILEAKLQLVKKPDWVRNHSVLNTGVTLNSAPSEVLYKKANDIEYQLEERVPFTPMPDEILGNVFNELGDLYATQQSIELSFIAYQFSLAYDTRDPYGVVKKMEDLKPVLKKNKIPIPSWKSHYLNRQYETVKNDIVNDLVESVILNKDSTQLNREKAANFISILNHESKTEKRSRIQKNIFIAAAVLVVLGIGVFVYLNKKRKQ